MSVGNKIALRRSEHLTIVLTFTFEIAEDLPPSQLLRLPELDTSDQVVRLDFPHPSILSDLHPQFMWSAKRTLQSQTSDCRGLPQSCTRYS